MEPVCSCTTREDYFSSYWLHRCKGKAPQKTFNLSQSPLFIFTSAAVSLMLYLKNVKFTRARSMPRSPFPFYAFFWQFYDFRSYISVFNWFLYVVWDMGPISFWMWISIFFKSIIYWRDYLFLLCVFGTFVRDELTVADVWIYFWVLCWSICLFFMSVRVC